MNAPVLTYSYSFTPEQPTGFAELDLVRVLQDIETDEGEPVPAGTRGTVVAVYASGAAFEVEFAYGTATIEAAHLTTA